MWGRELLNIGGGGMVVGEFVMNRVARTSCFQGWNVWGGGVPACKRATLDLIPGKQAAEDYGRRNTWTEAGRAEPGFVGLAGLRSERRAQNLWLCRGSPQPRLSGVGGGWGRAGQGSLRFQGAERVGFTSLDWVSFQTKLPGWSCVSLPRLSVVAAFLVPEIKGTPPLLPQRQTCMGNTHNERTSPAGSSLVPRLASQLPFGCGQDRGLGKMARGARGGGGSDPLSQATGGSRGEPSRAGRAGETGRKRRWVSKTLQPGRGKPNPEDSIQNPEVTGMRLQSRQARRRLPGDGPGSFCSHPGRLRPVCLSTGRVFGGGVE